MKISEIQSARAKAFDAFSAFGARDDFDATKDQGEYDRLKGEVEKLDGQMARAKEAQDMAVKSAQPAPGQSATDKVAAAPETDAYVKDKSLMVGAFAKMLALGKGSVFDAGRSAQAIYGESHPVTKALVTSTPSAGGYIVPPAYMAEIIEMLRTRTAVRSAGPRNIPMPRGNMTIPAQLASASAAYSGEDTPIATSQPSFAKKVASFKKLTALVPVSNDMLRYADPAIDAFVRDDLVKVMALREDTAFLTGDGAGSSPLGYLSFANAWAAASGGTAGVFSQVANSTLAVGGNFITATEAYTLATVANELAGAVNRLDVANVPDDKRTWFMNARTFNYLFSLMNSLGVYVYRDELAKGTLLGYPIKKSNQIGTGYWNADGSKKTGSLIFLVEMTEDMIFDSMQLELAVSADGSYVDAGGNRQSAFQNDETLIRAISEHDHLMRHDAAVAVIQDVQWSPAIQ